MSRGLLMARRFSLFISYLSIAVLIIAPLAAVYFVFNIDAFAELAQKNLGLFIQWQTVSTTQWYGLWLITIVFNSFGLVGMYFLYRAFKNFASGEFFNLANSRNLRWFSILLFIQAIAKPILFTLSSLLLSLNHPPGQKMLSVSLGSNEVTIIVLAMILWVTSDMLVKGSEIDSENKQFV